MNKITDIINQLAQEKVQAKREVVIKAIDELNKEGLKIKFTIVAKRADVNRNYLYKSEEFWPIIESIRDSPINKVQSKDVKGIIIGTQKKKINELQKQLKNLDAYEELKDKYSKALLEIGELKKQLKTAYKY